MDHNNKHLLPGFQFPASAAFAGLQNGNAFVQLSQLSSQLSNLSNPILPSPELNLSAWAAATQNQQWLDQAKLSAAMFPSLYLKGGLDYSQQVDITAQQVAAQAAQVQQQVHQVQHHVQQPTSIFPHAVFAAKIGKISSGLQHEYTQELNKNQSPLQQPLSSGPSSHPSTSTPHDIDVGGLSQPSSHHQVINHSPQKVLQAYEAIDENRPSTSTAVPSLPLSHDIFTPSISTSLSNLTQAWGDVSGDIMANLFNNTNKPDTNVDDSKEREEDDNINFLWGMDDDAIIDDEQSKNGKDKDLFAIDVRSADGLSPIQFTPPDSPVGAGSGAAEAAMGFAQQQRPGPSHLNGHVRPDMMEADRPTPVATPMLILPDTRRPDASSTPASLPKRLSTPRPPKPIAEAIYRKTEFVSKPVQKLNKVPVYKLKQKTLSALVVDDDGLKDDAYSFEDEEDHGVCKLDTREKLDAEVKEKWSKIASQPAGSSKNIYVPGVGFAVPQEPVPQQDLWRHVIPKKRPIAENRPIIPAANLLPSSVHAEASEAAARLAEPEILSLAESIRRRKKDRFVGNFVKFENTVSTECVKEEKKYEPVNTYGHSDENRPPLPKLIIKLPKKVYDSYEHKKKKKKKRKRRREEEDSDWEDNNYIKRSRGRSERRESGYEIRVVEPTVSFKQEEEKPEPMIPKKRRLLQWQEGQEVRANGQHNSNSSYAKAEFNTEAIKLRLSKFGPAEGHLPKGTFVVCKADLFRDDCALWKVDNQNMLQKYPPKVDPFTSLVSYKNSSTYSGWCEQIASGYYRVSVKHIKQTRSEAVVQPEIALSDLFPAMTSECGDTNGFFKLDEEQLPDSNEHMNLLRDPLRLSMYTYTQTMLDHALTLDRLQVMKDKNDWSFLQAVSDIERANEDSIVRINQQVQMRDEFVKLLQQYVQLLVIDHDAKEIHCQACSVEKRSVEKIVQLLCLDNYDRQSLMSQPFPNIDGEDPPLPACEMFVCSVCATAARQFHSCHHMSYHLLKKCEDRLELIGTQHPELSPERIVDVAKKTRGWQNNMFSDYVDMWKKIQNNTNTKAATHTSAMSYYTNSSSSFSAPSY